MMFLKIFQYFSLFFFVFLSLFGDETYHLREGDRLLISVYGEEESSREVVVSPTGTICFQNIQSMPARGKTIEQLREDITDSLKSYYLNPVISISGVDFYPGSYVISGEVREPGEKSLAGNPTILSAFCEARGFTYRLFRDQTIDMVDFNHSFLSRNGEYVPVDFSKLVEEGDMSQDMPLQNKDYLYVASYVMPRVYILGEVFRPLTINYLDTISLAEAISAAGGVTLRASSRVIVIRGSLACPHVFYIDINRIFKAYTCNFWLEPGDIVFVPAMKFTFLKESLQAAIGTFISTVTSVAGTNTFLEITPKAKNFQVLSPVPVINSGATQIIAPAPAPTQ